MTHAKTWLALKPETSAWFCTEISTVGKGKLNKRLTPHGVGRLIMPTFIVQNANALLIALMP